MSYDTDVTVWSPQGRLFQVEYACNAVTQGSAVIGLKSNKSVVLVALKRRATELESYNQKLFKIDDHLGVGIAGLNADGRVLHRHMRNECLNHKYVYGAPLGVSRLAVHLGQKAQKATISGSKRPYGVGMLLAGVDKTGTHLFETSPNGSINEYIAYSIGGRSQSAKTYLEKHFTSFDSATDDELIHHGLQALAKCLELDGKLTGLNVSVGIVGLQQTYRELSEAELQSALQSIQYGPASAAVPMEM